MVALRIDLDSGSRHYLLFTQGENNTRELSLHHSSFARHSLLHEAFRRHLVLSIDGIGHVFPAGSDTLTFPRGAKRLLIQLGRIEPIAIASVALEPEPTLEAGRYVLSPFESRYLADNGAPHPVASTANLPVNLQTDLHVHFAGCVSPPDLVRIGAEHGARYPAAMLAEIGIHIEGVTEVALSGLREEFLRQLEARLSIPLDHQATFKEMEGIYRLRSPITKNRAAFIPLCRQIAADYRAMGVKYAELSLYDVVQADRLRELHRELPIIEHEFGVQLRFLAAICRHDDLEWDLDYIERIGQIAGSRYVVGCDFMGHETNSTLAFAEQLRELAQWAHRQRPGFVIRVHAGENPAHPENVRAALESVEGCNVQLRIGHGLYGVDEATHNRLRDSGTIVEFNLNSNFALNNIQDARAVPISEYIRHGIPAVLGTDGYGIYQTTAALEARAALLCGLSEADFAHIRATESRYIEKQNAIAATLREPAAFVVPEAAPFRHYTQEVMDRKAKALYRRDEMMLDRLREIQVPLLNPSEVATLMRGRQCICFAGAWKSSWNIISPGNQQIIRDELEKLLRALPTGQTLLITGGTDLGVEGVVQKLAMPMGFKILGAIVSATPIDSLNPGAITHAHLVGQSLYDKAAGLYRLMKTCNGLCLFIGGGSIVNDEIQTAGNLRLHYLVMDGPEGASTLQARQQPERAFRSAADILDVLNKNAPATSSPFWHPGPNPTVDMIVTRHDPVTGRKQVLLIQRDVDAPTEGGKWALPGGFQLTDAPRGTPWRPGPESAPPAAVRELLEESGLDLRDRVDQLLFIGAYEGGNRDPRDTPEAWSRSEVFAAHVSDDRAASPLCGADDACDARWFDVNDLPNLAFDHAKILDDGLARMRSAG